MKSRYANLSVALVLTLGLGTEASAAGAYDPTLTWRTIESPRFRVHYPDDARNLAIRVSRIAEAELDRVAELFGYAPDTRIEIVLTDASDSANGSAGVVPQNRLTIRVTAPSELTGLAGYDDWLRILLIHEMAHICDIDQTHGFTSFLDAIFGPYLRMNSYTPQFLTEGVAVYAETLLTATGRGRSSFVDMIIRMSALEGEFLRIDQAHLFTTDWPGGSGAYFFGGRFHLWLAEKYGIDKVRDLHQIFAAMPLPFIYWPGSKWIFDAGLADLWDQWREHEVARARQIRDRVVAQGVTESRRITHHGRNITGNRYDPQGNYIIYSRSSPVDGSTVRRVNRDGTDDRDLILETYSPRFTFTSDGKSLYVSQNAINVRFNDYNDLHRYDFDTEEFTRIADIENPDESLRARDPDVSPDNQRIVFVQQRLHQSWVTMGTFDKEDPDRMHLKVLIPPWGDRQHASPRFSPDGTLVAVSSWFEGGERDILVVDANDGSLVRRITHDAGLDGSPAWSPDGRYLLWESETEGISNVFAYDWQERIYYQVTNVVGGAFQPDVHPSGKTMLFRNASGIGFDIHEMPFDPATWTPVRYEPATGYTPLDAPAASAIALPAPDPWGVSLPRDEEPPVALRPDESEYDYLPQSLVPFNDNWVLYPAVFISGDDPGFSLSTFVVDSLGEHSASLAVGSSWYTAHVNWAISYTNDMWYPSFRVGYSDTADAFAAGDLGHAVRRVQSVGTGISLPIFLRHVLGVSYVYQHREPRDELSAQLLGIDENGLDYAWLQFGYAYANTRSYPYSVGREEGGAVALAGRWYSRDLGGGFDELMMTLDARGYINNPWLDNHVLALRLVSAFAFGPEFQERFALGGASSSSFFTTEAAQTFPLRGFPLDVGRYPPGIGVFAGYAEYRFPIWHMERGLWTLPVYVERLHAAVFAEAGASFGDGTEEDVEELAEAAWEAIQNGRLGAGGELGINLILGWGLPLSIRLGLAFPIVDGGDFGPAPQTDLGKALGFEVIPYLAFGSTI